MPYTLNGVGTAYWGKKNQSFRRSSCDHCGTDGELASYDTTRYFVVLFLPVIPLGQLKILEECPSCRRHRVMKLSDWEDLKTSSLDTALTNFRRQPTSPEIAMELLSVAVAWGGETRFLEASKAVLQHHGRDAEVLALISQILHELGHDDQAEAALRRSLDAEESPERRRFLTWLVIRNGRPAESRSWLASAYADQDRDALPILYFLVEGFQAQGQHGEALKELDAIAESFPDQAEDLEFQSLREASAARRESGEAVVTAAFKPLKTADRVDDWSGGIARWAIPAVLLLVLLVGAWKVFDRGFRHPVYFVNGLDSAYSVEIDGRQVKLPVGGAHLRKLPLRRPLTVIPSEGAPAFEPFGLEIGLSVIDGLTSDQVVVVNPDRTALLLLDRTEYVAAPAARPGSSAREQPWEAHAGQPSYRFADVDFRFRDFPEEIEMPSRSKRVVKSRLDVLDAPDRVIWQALQEDQAADGAAVGWITAVMELGLADDLEYPYFLGEAVGRERYRTLAASYLDARPVKMQWHRAYQDLFVQAADEQWIESYYGELLEADPEDSDLRYLLYRVIQDEEEAKAFLDRSLAASQPSPWLHYSAAMRHLAAARFDAALEWARKGVAAAPDNPWFQYLESQALLASGQFEELGARSLEARGESVDLAAIRREILFYQAAGLEAKAESIRETMLPQVSDEQFSDQVIWLWKRSLAAATHLGRRDLDGYAESISGIEIGYFPMHRALLEGDGAAVLRAMGDGQEPPVEELLLAYLACRDQASEAAEGFLVQAIGRLEKGGHEDRLVAAALAADTPPTATSPFVDLQAIPPRKAPILAALASVGGPDAAALHQRAYELAYDIEFEGQLLRRILDRTAASHG